MQQQQLKSEQARERLQLDQSGDEPITLRADREIDHEKVRMRRFIWNFQSFGNRVLRISREFWGAGKIDNRGHANVAVLRRHKIGLAEEC